jgi:glycosyltransferase involved in cell wall biosynthesis
MEKQATVDIALYLPSLAGGGAERVVLNLAAGFTAAGKTVCLLVDRAGGTLEKQVPAGIGLHVLNAKKTLLAGTALRAKLQELQPQALLAALPCNNIVAARVKGQLSFPIRVVLSDHNVLSAQFFDPATSWLRRVWGALQIRLMRRYYPLADAVVTVSQAIADDYHKLGIKGVAPVVIGNPVLPLDWQQQVAAPLPWGEAASLPKPRILAVGRLTAQKGFDCLLHAFASLHPHTGGSLLIVGEGEERPALEALAQTLGIGGAVYMPGFFSPILPVYREAEVFALSSVYEGFGNVVVEAMAAGLPVVATRSGGPEEILENGQHGRLVPPGDAAALAAALRDALNNQLRADKSPHPRALQYTTAGVSERYLALFNEITPG